MPRSAIPHIKSFTDAGGVLVGLGSKLPFVVGIEPIDDGRWTMSPRSPKFAWQTGEVLGHFHMKYVYKPTMHDQALRFTATPLLQRYAPGVSDPSGPLQNWCIVPYTARGVSGEYFPLIRSQRVDGADVTPQLSVVRRDGRHAVLGFSRVLVDESDPKKWAHGRAVVVGIAHLARDLRAGLLVLDESMRVEVDPALGPAAPLRRVMPVAEADPEGLEPIARWGRFDGSNLELDGSPIPPVLDPGERLVLELPEWRGTARLRVRAAYAKSNAGLRVRLDDRLLWDELLLYIDASGMSNHTAGAYNDVPAEVTRLIALPASSSGRLELSNPGREPLHLDAVQVEPADASPSRLMGMYTPLTAYTGKPLRIDPAVTGRWSVTRADLKSDRVGPPGDPRRWEHLDEHMARLIEVNPKLNLILQGTPEWAAISPERYALGKKAGRPYVVPPDTEKYKEIVNYVIDRYAEHVVIWEIGNETDIQQFWRGTTE
ncbi:MAG: hypothetical protein AAF797_06420 [Planctomycetota bacterium]